MSDLGALLSISIGGVAYQLENYSFKSEPVMRDDQHVGDTISVDGKGYIEGTSAADLAAKMAIANVGLRTSGQDIIIKGLGGVAELALYAAACLDGGPHLGCDMEEQTEVLRKEFKFRAKSNVPAASKDGKPSPNTGKVSKEERPDGTKTITYSGDLYATDAQAAAQARVDDLNDQYPSTDWTWRTRVENTITNNKATYEAVFTQILVSLPSDGAGNNAVDGEMTTSTTRDEQYRMLTRVSYDLLIRGSPTALRDSLRPTGTILRESCEYTAYKGIRLRAEFETLASGDQNDLVDWRQSIEYTNQNSGLVEAAHYVGIAPILFVKPAEPIYVTQSGSAIGLGRYPKPATQILDLLTDAPMITFNQLNSVECETRWSYKMATVGAFEGPKFIGKLVRPTGEAADVLYPVGGTKS